MKILLIGSKYRVITFANQLILKGEEVHIVSNRKISNGELGKLNPLVVVHEDLVNRLKKDNSNSYYVNFFFNIVIFKRLIRKVKPDLVHAFYIQQNGWLAAFSGFHPLIVTTMGSDINRNQGAYSSLIRRTLLSYTIKKADLVTVQSKQGFDEVQGNKPKKPPIFFRAGYDHNLFYPSHKSLHLLDKYSLNNKFVVFSPRGFNKSFYNIETVVRGFGLFQKTVKNSVLLMLGSHDNEYGLKIKKMIGELNLQEHVIFIGLIDHDQLNEYFNLADVAVSFTLKDGFPASLTEIMACGKPIIAGENNSINELITNYENGYIVEPLDEEALSDRLLKLYNDNSLIRKIGLNSITSIKQHSALHYCETISKMYTKLITECKKQNG